MGGHVKREQFVSLGKSVLLPSWLLECWAHRDDFDFDPKKSELISKHRIGVFERLKIFVYGFNEVEDEDIKRGSIVTDFSEATHCVINSSTLDLNTLPSFKDQKLVTNEVATLLL
ncbi:unnamed protein product [Angiostrongylus costaricensis]|uniref:BRCT domain-containing protein n=1 Tax=Angiostrongylus costaricensis TaxID=334426 RepID=A0A0R3PTM7_ANGCS|nr:unnamed protein product [Angiostrongylus costaricensis]